MRKLWAIVWKENYIRFTDRAGILYMFIAPLALSFVIGAAFSGLAGGGGDVPDFNIPLGIVNQDAGSGDSNYGDIFVQALVPADLDNPDPDNALFQLINARLIDDEAEARRLVERGELAAALFIPADFTASLAPTQADFTAAGEQGQAIESRTATMQFYWNSGSSFQAPIVRDVIAGIANNIATSNIAVNTTVSGLVESIPQNVGIGIQLATGALNETIGEVARRASQRDANPITIEQVNVEGEAQESQQVDFGFFAPGIAIFFTGFTVALGSVSMLEERRNWTLQRMVTTPTARSSILAGKMAGTYVGGVLQLVFLIVVMTLMISVMTGQVINVFGTDLLALVLLVLAIVAAGTGLGTILAALARTPEQANNLGGVVLTLMGLASGVFFPVNALPDFFKVFSYASFHWWGREAFFALGAGGTLADILPAILALLVMTVVFFGIGLWLFSRRLEA